MNPIADGRSLIERPPVGTGGEFPLTCLEQALGGVRLYYALAGALELGLFDRLRSPMTAVALAAELGTRPDETALLCESLAIHGLLAFQGRHVERWRDLARLLREGPELMPREEFFRHTVIPSMAEHARCGLLQQVAGIVGGLPGFAEAESLLDLGGGHGLYAIALCQMNPRLRATVFDLPAVTETTRDFIDRYGADRVSVVAGDFNTDPLPGPVDIVFSSSNPGGKDPALIPKIAGALKPGGLFLNKQGIDSAETDPLLDLEWNLWTFDGVKKQRSRYSFSHSVPLAGYHRALEANGLSVLTVIPVDGTSEMTVARKSA